MTVPLLVVHIYVDWCTDSVCGWVCVYAKVCLNITIYNGNMYALHLRAVNVNIFVCIRVQVFPDLFVKEMLDCLTDPKVQYDGVGLGARLMQPVWGSCGSLDNDRQ